MSEIKIMIATPCYTGQCYMGYALSLVKTYTFFSFHKQVKLLHKFISYDCSIPRARNTFVATMLSDPTITHLLFIDADMKWEPEDIGKLIMAKKPIIGAAIPKKNYNWDRLRQPQVRQLIMDDTLSAEEFQKLIKMYLVDYAVNLGETRQAVDGIIEADTIGTAFLLIERNVLEKMCAAFGQRKISKSPTEMPEQDRPYFYSLFDQENREGEYLSSDYCFCRLWQSIGGKVYADLSINLGHQGSEEYEGNLVSISKTSAKYKNSPSQ